MNVIHFMADGSQRETIRGEQIKVQANILRMKKLAEKSDELNFETESRKIGRRLSQNEGLQQN